jgi:hypothetical protein
VRDPDSATGWICWPCLEADADQAAEDFHDEFPLGDTDAEGF